MTHLGLLFSEMRHVSASLAFPGVKPTPVASSTTRSAEEARPVVILGLEFPPISHAIEWPALFLRARPSR